MTRLVWSVVQMQPFRLLFMSLLRHVRKKNKTKHRTWGGKDRILGDTNQSDMPSRVAIDTT